MIFADDLAYGVAQRGAFARRDQAFEESEILLFNR